MFGACAQIEKGLAATALSCLCWHQVLEALLA
jgi:hypothetical protein